MTATLRDRWRGLRTRLAPTRTAELERAIPPGSSVLDVGCGTASPLLHLRSRLSSLGGIDAFAAAADAGRRSGKYDVVVEGDVQELDRHFEPASYDVVVAIDLLEHLDEASGDRLLAAMERVARRRVVVLTPNGFVDQDALAGNPWQVHRSGWTPRQLRQRGYVVRGVHGLRMLRGEEARFRAPARLSALVSDLSAPLAQRVPSLAYHLLATKDVA
jgi:SAM-dependent methyltransferase